MKYIFSGNKSFRIGKKEYIHYYSSLPKDGSIIGYIRVRDNNTDIKDDWLEIHDKKYRIFNEKPGKLIGYLKTGENDEFIGLTVNKTICPRWLIMLSQGWIFTTPAALVSGAVILTAATGGGIAAYQALTDGPAIVTIGGGSTEKDPTGTESIGDYNNTEDDIDADDQKYTIIDAIVYNGDCLEVTASDTIPLGNNPENEGINLQYIVKENDKEIYVSQTIEPGQQIDWKPADYLSEGRHDLVVTANVYHQDTGMQDIGTDMNVTVNVTK